MLNNIMIANRLGEEVANYSKFIFPGGETQVKITPFKIFDNTTELVITSCMYSAQDIMETALVLNALRHMENFMWVKLVIPYVPYARQDRVCSPGEAFSLEMIANFIVQMDYDELEVWDIHSGVFEKLLGSRGILADFKNVHAWDFVRNIKFTNIPIVVVPDKGALPRGTECANGLNAAILYGEKIRNTETGEITGTRILNPIFVDNNNVVETTTLNSDLGDNDILIVDDICDGGRTFIELAKILRPLTTGKIMLYVTHGIFSKGQEVLFEAGIDEIYTAHLFPNTKNVSNVNIVERN